MKIRLKFLIYCNDMLFVLGVILAFVLDMRTENQNQYIVQNAFSKAILLKIK